MAICMMLFALRMILSFGYIEPENIGMRLNSLPSGFVINPKRVK